MAVHFDLTDVAAHAATCASLTGIQRVQIESVRCVVRREPRFADIFANLYGAHVDLAPRFVDSRLTGAEAIFTQMRRLFSPLPALGLSRRTMSDAGTNGVLKLRGASARLRQTLFRPRRRFGPSDCLYVGGAFWAHPRCVRTYEQAARDGCDVVALFHDVLPVVFPDLADAGCRPLFERMLRLPARAITVSRHAQAQIEWARRAVGAPHGLAPATIAPLAHEFPAAPRNFVGQIAPSRRLAAIERSGPFALCVGSIEPRNGSWPM